ncbi:MAG: MarR family transcriptional regulator [Proteobacteria bacterium]|nr:MarR family transcriptional regulator [Pseudomonadota bacterium]
MSDLATPEDRIARVRDFNRFYTRRIGVLGERLLDTKFSLAESRLLWELAHRDATTGSELSRELQLDAGYLSRLLGSFKERGLVKATRSKDDARHLHVSLTAAGRRAYAPLDERTHAQITALLARLTEAEQQRLLRAMTQVRRLLDDEAAPTPALLLRSHRPGDIGWVVARHGALYAREYGWDMTFEALVARIAADFIDRYDPKREACWIAERDGEPVGSVFLVQARDDAGQAVDGVAQLRMLLVEPEARGLGLGARLVDECERYARHAGYRKITLWTNSILTAARGIYAKAGYVLIASESHHSFGHELVAETWEMSLD